MHRWWLTIAALTVGMAGELGAQQAIRAPSKPIFRYVALNRDTLWLGRPIGALARYARYPTDTVVTVPLGEFGGTDAIQVFRTRSDTVASFVFLYGVRHSMAALLAEYEGDLGAPQAIGRDSIAGVARQFWIWRDDLTEFTLASFSAPLDGAVGAARLTDRPRRAP